MKNAWLGLVIGMMILVIGCARDTKPVMDLGVSYTSWRTEIRQPGKTEESVFYVGLRNEGRNSYDTIKVMAEAFDVHGEKLGDGFWSAEKLISYVSPFRFGHLITAELVFKDDIVLVNPETINHIVLKIQGTSRDVKIGGELKIDL